jgi:uncharacterized membrane protein YgaE (UPF0421/DUF939 family)
MPGGEEIDDLGHAEPLIARATAMKFQPHISGFQLALRAAVAAGASVAIAQALSLEYPIYAFLAAVIVTDLLPSQSRHLGLRRLLATVLGAACGATLSPIVGPGPWGIGLSVLAAMLLSQLAWARDAARVAGYICGIVVLDYSAAPWAYAFHRVIETALGVVVAWAISYVPKLIRMDELEKQP